MSTPAESDSERSAAVLAHPLYPIFIAAIEQAIYGKGERHGGGRTPFLQQPWVHYADIHGRGFLTGQAAKKLEEASSLREGKAFETEVLGALVYGGMAVIKERWNCGRMESGMVPNSDGSSIEASKLGISIGHPLASRVFSQTTTAQD